MQEMLSRPDLLLALLTYAFVTSVTPGPNNLMLMASGANFGFRRSLPHMIGVSLGAVVMVLVLGLGLAGVVTGWPPAMLGLKAISTVYMLWLAWKIAHATAPDAAQGRVLPMTLVQAMAFQWVNPKAWAMALGAVAAYLPDPTPLGCLLVAVAFATINLPSVAIWAAAGQGLRRWLQAPARLRAFNWTMAVLLVASLWPVLRLEMPVGG